MTIKENREFMKANFTDLEGFQTDQQKKIPHPALHKDYPGKVLIPLPEVKNKKLVAASLEEVLYGRASRRQFEANHLMTLEELSFLLYATQGVRKAPASMKYSMRMVPSGGARQAFETYLAVYSVSGLAKGLYYYHPFAHSLIYLGHKDNLEDLIIEANMGQSFVAQGNVTFLWSCVPYRSEWRYHVAAHKTMLLDAGHLCQNLYIASEGIGYGTCAIGAYDQEKADALLNLDGQDEFIVYIAPVGKITLT